MDLNAKIAARRKEREEESKKNIALQKEKYSLRKSTGPFSEQGASYEREVDGMILRKESFVPTSARPFSIKKIQPQAAPSECKAEAKIANKVGDMVVGCLGVFGLLAFFVDWRYAIALLSLSFMVHVRIYGKN